VKNGDAVRAQDRLYEQAAARSRAEAGVDPAIAEALHDATMRARTATGAPS
jgi:hypothetical protein